MIHFIHKIPKHAKHNTGVDAFLGDGCWCDPAIISLDDGDTVVVHNDRIGLHMGLDPIYYQMDPDSIVNEGPVRN